MPGPTFITCTKCGLVFDSGAGSRPIAPPRKHGRDRPSPDDDSTLRVESDGERLVMSWPASRLTGLFLLAISAPVLYVMSLGVLMAWKIVFLLGPIALLLVYPTVACLFNRGYVIVDKAKITTRDRPFPLGGSLVAPRTGLEQIYVELIPAGHRRVQQYCVTAYYGRARPDRLGERAIAYVRSLDRARELEQRLERHLGLVDRREYREVPLDET